MKIKSPYSNKFGMYCFLPFHSMTVTFDIKRLIFWILGNAFYGTSGMKNSCFGCSSKKSVRVYPNHLRFFRGVEGFAFAFVLTTKCKDMTFETLYIFIKIPGRCPILRIS